VEDQNHQIKKKILNLEVHLNPALNQIQNPEKEKNLKSQK